MTRKRLHLLLVTAGIAGGVLLCCLARYVAYPSVCSPRLPAKSSFGTSPILDEPRIDPSFLLVPVMDGRVVYLLDLYGRSLHAWQTELPVFYAVLLPNGNLLVELITAYDKKEDALGGRTGLLQELTWDGRVVWQYRDPKLHHDIDPLPGGRVAVLRWVKVPSGIARKIRGGVPGSEREGVIWTDQIAEIDRAGNTVWSWDAYRHLDPTRDQLGPLDRRREWTHANSIQYVPDLGVVSEPSRNLRGKDGYLISFREISTVALLRRDTGEIVWRSPEQLFAHQHDASVLPNGNILVFDNGLHRTPGRAPWYGSAIVVIDPRSNAVVWKYNSHKDSFYGAQLYASVVSGAQLLANGNTLIAIGLSGHFLEVTPDRKVVWDLLNPYGSAPNAPWPRGGVFKARRYAPWEIAWPERIGDPLPWFAKWCRRLGDSN
ncbi:MAG: aryl-sulfate sulfotransferase [Pseudomonadota bacterium]